MKHIAIIPARSGSKGLIDKNIKELNGKPLLAYTIEAAEQSQCFDEIMVSTDSNQYAEIAKKYGATVPFLRSKALASDNAQSWKVVKDVLAQYKQRGKTYDTVALLQPTSPLRTAQDIIDGYAVMYEKDANTVVAVCETEHSPLWSNTLDSDHSLTHFIREEIKGKRRQDLPTYYQINGALYLVKTNYLHRTDDILKEKSVATIMSQQNSVDIDNDIDFLLAESLLKNTSK